MDGIEEGSNGTDGSVSDVSQAYTSVQSAEYCGMPVAYTHQDTGVRR